MSAAGASGWESVARWLLEVLLENLALLAMAVAALLRAMGVTVRSGTTGLLFSFGRARRVVPPGFQVLLPFVQRVRVLPTRARTLDLAPQRMATGDGLVIEVECNLVYRIVDVRRAWVEVDDLEAALPRTLALGVHEVLRGRGGRELLASRGLDAELERVLSRRVEPWGVVVERAGLTSIRPTAHTLLVTQLARTVEARRRCQLALAGSGGAEAALLLASTGPRLVRRARRAAERERVRALLRAREERARGIAAELAGPERGWVPALLRRARLAVRPRPRPGGPRAARAGPAAPGP